MLPAPPQFNKDVEMFDLSLIPFIPVDDKTKKKFITLLNLKLVEKVNNFNLLCGYTLSATSLLSFETKEKTYKVLCAILDNLINTKLDIKEIDLTKRKILIALDQASLNFSVVLEFSKFTTTITIVSEPDIVENQTTFHIKRKIVDTITLTSTLRTFITPVSSPRIFQKDQIFEASNRVGYIYFDLQLKEYHKLNPGIESLTLKLDEDLVIKHEQAKYVFSKFSKDINDIVTPDTYNAIKISFTGIQCMFGPFVELITIEENNN